MSQGEFEADVAERRRYIPSGRVNWFALVPLLLAGIVVALVMAFLLLLAEDNLYYYFVTPLVLGLPVFGMTWVIIRVGKCRNRSLAGLVGLVLAFVYYAGYWELSYLANVVLRGPRAVAAVRQMSGVPGLPGYFLYRCRNSQPVDAVRGAQNPRPPNTGDLIFNLVFFGLETVMVTCIAIGIGRSAASRVFSERLRKWSAKLECRLPVSTAAHVVSAVNRHDWAALGALPRMSSAGNANTNSLQFRVEYFPGVVEEPAYISVLGRGALTRQQQILQREIEADDLLRLAREFPDLKIAQAPRGEAVSAPRTPSALQASLDQIGLGDARADTLVGSQSHRKPTDSTAAGDFRDSAVAASEAILAAQPGANLRTIASSLCLVASEDGRRELKAVGSRRMIIQVCLFVGWVGCLLLGLLGTTMKDAQGKETPQGRALMLAGIIGFFALAVPSLISMSAGDRLAKPFLAGRLRARPGSLVELGADLKSTVLRVEDARTYHKQKLSGEDMGIALFDRANRRILLEGLSHRYVICGEDVACFWPVQAGEVISVRIDYRVGDVTLPLVLATRNPYSQMQFLAEREVKRVMLRYVETLRCEVSSATAGPSAV
jgi:hypothetical protein